VADQKREESFRIIDRRPFTAEGELRQEIVEQEKRDQEAAAVLPKPPVSAPGSANTGSTPSVGVASLPTAEAVKPSRSFQMLVDFLARNAAVFLGGYADPGTGQAMVDLDGARELIDMLDVLREKTRGNVAAEDDRLLLDVLGSLKLTFLEVSKAATQAMKEKTKSRP